MSTEKLQRQYDALVAGFVAPLVTGGVVQLDRAIAPNAIDYFQHASSGDADAERAIYDALHRGGSGIAPSAVVSWPSRDVILLAMAAHNLVMLTDPEMDRLFARGARNKVIDWIDRILDMTAIPATRSDALGRHALIDPLPSLRRKDIVAKSWAYTYRFLGRPVTSSLLSRPVIGNFKTTDNMTDLGELLARVDAKSSLGLQERLRALLSRSPVTELIRPDLCGDLRFSLGTMAVLSDGAIRAGVARALVERGEWTCAAVLGRALSDASLLAADADLIWYALALCFEVHMTAELDTPGPSLPDRLDLTDPHVAAFAAVLPAIFDDAQMIDEVRAFDDDDRVEVQDRCARLTKLVPEAVRAQVSELVTRARRPRLISNNVEVRP